jgi:hypothetical protein
VTSKIGDLWSHKVNCIIDMALATFDGSSADDKMHYLDSTFSGAFQVNYEVNPTDSSTCWYNSVPLARIQANQYFK